jgi:hypothetical protein
MKKNIIILTSFTLVLYAFAFTFTNLFAQQLHETRNANTTYESLIYNNGSCVSVPVTGESDGNKFYAPFSEQEGKNGIDAFNWVLKFTASNKVFKDISFANTQVGYIVTELGAVYKTTNGGDNWVSKLNLGFPYYWYGVSALSPDTVVISGFNNQGPISSGVVRWTFNGGDNWSQDIILRIPSGVGWLDKVHFFNQNTGIVAASFSGGVHYTITGGKDSSAWSYIQINQDLAWFAGNIDAQSSGNVYMTGIHLARSTNFGLNWTSGPSADNVFDGGVDFLDNNNLYGWTGGGQISAPVSGWVHRTTDGGATWSTRLNVFPYPIRAVKFFDPMLGFAAGGNLYQEAGGIYSTTNGGLNWNLDVNTSAEMFSMDSKTISADSVDIWCVGSTGGGTGYTGKLYKTRANIVTGIAGNGNNIPEKFELEQNYPNPFNPKTIITYVLPVKNYLKLSVFDITGKQIAELVNMLQSSGKYEVEFDGSGLSSGVYFYKLDAGNFTSTKRMVLIK